MSTCVTCSHSRKAKAPGYVGCLYWSKRGVEAVIKAEDIDGEVGEGWIYPHLPPQSRPDTATSHIIARDHIVIEETGRCNSYQKVFI